MRYVSRITAALLLCAGASRANAADYPDIVQRFLDNAAKLCTEHGGKPGTPPDAIARKIDINGDRKEDWVIDYRHFPCEGGAPDIFCAAGFCGLDILTYRSENVWKLMLHASVARWRVRIGDKPALMLLQSGEFCGRKKQPQCTVVYTFKKGTMIGHFQDANYFSTK